MQPKEGLRLFPAGKGEIDVYEKGMRTRGLVIIHGRRKKGNYSCSSKLSGNRFVGLSREL